MRRLTAKDYAVDAVTAAKALVGAWLCRRLEDGTIMRRRLAAHRHSLRLPARPAPQVAVYRRGAVVAKEYQFCLV